MNKEIVTLCCNYPTDKDLHDHRLKRYGSSLGTLNTLSKQYGVEIKEENGYRFYSAPKRRMNFFIEKLHFANISYTVI